MAKAKGKTLQLGAIWAEKDEKGEETGKIYITLDKGIKGISLNAEDYKGNDVSGDVMEAGNGKIYLNADDPVSRQEFFLSNGNIDKATFDQRVASIPDNLIAEITVKVG